MQITSRLILSLSLTIFCVLFSHSINLPCLQLRSFYVSPQIIQLRVEAECFYFYFFNLGMSLIFHDLFFLSFEPHQGPGKRGQIVADTLLSTQMFRRLPARATFVADTDFVSATNVSQFAQPKKHHGQQCGRPRSYYKRFY